MRKCPTCQTTQDDDQFKKGYKDCRLCINKRNRDRARNIRAGNTKVKFGPTPRKFDSDGNISHKQCGRCREMLSVDMFNKNRYNKDSYDNRCRQCNKAVWRNGIEDRRIPNLISRCKTLAKKNNFPFNLAIEDITIPERCPVLGILLIFGKESDNINWRDNSPSIDKIIPELGYVRGNIIIVSYRANRIKNDATIDELQLVASFYKNITSVD